jgi:TRAP transporter TAXI family solute receptor
MGMAGGCGGDGPGATFYSIGTGGTGGVYYPLGGALASRLSVMDSVGRYTAEVTGGSVENVNRVRFGQIDLGFSLSVTAYQAYRGTGDFKEDPVSDLRIVAPLYPNRIHVLVGRNVDAESLDQLRGARVSVGSAGSGTEQSARELLEAFGLTYDDVQVQYLSFSESSAALRDGAIDAAIISVGYPAGAVLEATTTGGARLLTVEGPAVDALAERYPYYYQDSIPEGIYPGMDAPLPTVSMMNWVVALEGMDHTVVGAVLNVLGPDRVSLEQVHEMASQIEMASLERAPIPLHPATRAWLDGRSR